MYATEEIRFKAGDACCSILSQGYDVTLSEHMRVIGQQPLQGRAQKRVGTGRAKESFSWWRWSRCHQSELGIARSLTDVPIRHT